MRQQWRRTYVVLMSLAVPAMGIDTTQANSSWSGRALPAPLIKHGFPMHISLEAE